MSWARLQDTKDTRSINKSKLYFLYILATNSMKLKMFKNVIYHIKNMKHRYKADIKCVNMYITNYKILLKLNKTEINEEIYCVNGWEDSILVRCHSPQNDLWLQWNHNKIPGGFVKTDKLVLKFIWKWKDLDSKNNLEKRRTKLEDLHYLTLKFIMKLQ